MPKIVRPKDWYKTHPAKDPLKLDATTATVEENPIPPAQESEVNRELVRKVGVSIFRGEPNANVKVSPKPTQEDIAVYEPILKAAKANFPTEGSVKLQHSYLSQFNEVVIRAMEKIRGIKKEKG